MSTPDESEAVSDMASREDQELRLLTSFSAFESREVLPVAALGSLEDGGPPSCPCRSTLKPGLALTETQGLVVRGPFKLNGTWV